MTADRPAYLDAIAAAFDAGLVLDGADAVVAWNAAATELLGHASADAVGRPLGDLGFTEALPVTDGRAEQVVARADGSHFRAELSVARLSDDHRLVWVREFESELRWGDELIERESELRNMGERLRTLVANLPLGVIVEDEDRNLILVNDELLRIFAMDRTEASVSAGQPHNIGAAFATLFADPDGFLARREEVLARRERVLAERITATSGRIYERSFLPIVVDGSYEGQVWLWHDVTEQVSHEEARERALAAEVALNAALQEQVESLAELNRYKTEFVATVSHELRTPLTAVVGFSELLMMEEGLTADQRGFVEVIDRSAGRLLRLVGDLMFLARAEAGGLELEVDDVDVARLCREAAEESAPADQEQGVATIADIADGPVVRADAVRIRQIVDNLLSNARKFTPAGGTITLRAQPVGDGWRVEVSDTGIGIAPEEQEHIFDRFYRASNAARGKGTGIGLGLAVSRAIVDLHRGSISLESTLGVGTTVRVELPVAGPAEGPVASPIEPA